MELKDLHYLLAIYETGHMGKAALSLGITQPALSKCIQRLEKIYAARLLYKAGRGIKLTEAGLLLCERAQKIVQLNKTTQREIAALAEGTAGYVRIGAAATAAEFMLPCLTNQLLAQAPTVQLELKVGMNDLLQGMLRENQLDLVIGFLPENEQGDEFTMRPLQQEPVVVVAGHDHPLAGQRPKLQTLAQYGWLLPSRTVATRQWLEQRLKSLGCPPPRVQIEANSLAVLPRLISQTRLLSFVSRRILLEKQSAIPLVEIPLPELTMPRTFGLLFHSWTELSPTARNIVRIAEKCWPFNKNESPM
ncbi:LysR family transcriptional regulator [Gibbsiella quercinecans]|uniref:LysR family transcriptional regulator n=1 Tax=Gibbsiella quercinecans TaxID=929813 RepID=UPI000EF24DF9|nr:LysR family transcriptional regulator [Gibbsiella quercinecans]RLM15225.1 LysR family transcriptional regulator [Gibbsiella quercinecans]